jgi:DnaJ domain
MLLYFCYVFLYTLYRESKTARKPRRKGNYYKILNVPKNATSLQVHQSYRHLDLQWNHDNNCHMNAAYTEECQNLFRNIRNAYKVLKDVEAKAKYDRCEAMHEDDSGADELHAKYDRCKIVAKDQGVDCEIRCSQTIYGWSKQDAYERHGSLGLFLYYFMEELLSPNSFPRLYIYLILVVVSPIPILRTGIWLSAHLVRFNATIARWTLLTRSNLRLVS